MRLLVTILSLICAVSPRSYGQIAYNFEHLEFLGKYAESIALGGGRGLSAYSNLYTQLQLNEGQGYLGKDPNIHQQEMLAEITAFLASVESGGANYVESGKVNHKLVSNNLFRLVGASIALRSIAATVSDINTISLFQRQLYNRNCFNYSAFPQQVDIKKPPEQDSYGLIWFIWNSECYRFKHSFQYAQMALQSSANIIGANNQLLKETKDPGIRKDIHARIITANSLPLGLMVDVFNSRDLTSDWIFSVNQKAEEQVNLVQKAIAHARELNYLDVEFEFRKELTSILDKISDLEARKENASRMKELSLKYGDLSWLQRVNLHTEGYITAYGIVSLLLLAFIIYLTLRLTSHRQTQNMPKTNQSPLLESVLILIGATKKDGWVGVARSIWFFILTSSVGLFFANSRVDMTKITLIKSKIDADFSLKSDSK